MFRWLTAIDETVFSPPHKFETVLALVGPYIGLVFNEGADKESDTTSARSDRIIASGVAVEEEGRVTDKPR
jgi:hypothetical protein